MKLNERRYLFALICILCAVLAATIFLALDPAQSFRSLFLALMPEAIGSLIVFPIIYFFFQVRGVKIDDSEEQNLVQNIAESVMSEKEVNVFRNQSDANKDLEGKLKVKKISTAKLIQYSGDYVIQVVRELIERGSHVSLLLKDPNFAHDDHQRRKIEGRLSDFTTNRSYQQAINEGRFYVYLYKPDSSIRAVKVDDILIIGSYTYVDEVHGEDNFVVMFSDQNNVKAISACETFQSQYDYLKKNSRHWLPTGSSSP